MRMGTITTTLSSAIDRHGQTGDGRAHLHTSPTTVHTFSVTFARIDIPQVDIKRIGLTLITTCSHSPFDKDPIQTGKLRVVRRRT